MNQGTPRWKFDTDGSPENRAHLAKFGKKDMSDFRKLQYQFQVNHSSNFWGVYREKMLTLCYVCSLLTSIESNLGIPRYEYLFVTCNSHHDLLGAFEGPSRIQDQKVHSGGFRST